jgi:hypothetical protein
VFAAVFEWVGITCMIAIGFAHEFWAWRRIVHDEDGSEMSSVPIFAFVRNEQCP